MDVFKAIQERRSCRKYCEKPVEFEKVTLMLEAASYAPSAGNLQQWKFVLVNDKESIKKIARHAYNQQWIETAPLLIVVCSLCEKCERFYGKRGSELYSIQNTAAATENMLLTATALGLGTCWVGAFDPERIKDVLKIPANVNVHAMVTVGYAAAKPEKKSLVPINSFVYFNSYGMPVSRMNRVMNDYSLEVEKVLDNAQPALDSLLEKMKGWLKGKKK